MWELIKSDIPANKKLTSLKKFDQVLGLRLFEHKEEKKVIPQNILDLIHEREGFRKAGDYSASDELRKKIHELGYEIKDTKEGPDVRKINTSS